MIHRIKGRRITVELDGGSKLEGVMLSDLESRDPGAEERRWREVRFNVPQRVQELHDLRKSKENVAGTLRIKSGFREPSQCFRFRGTISGIAEDLRLRGEVVRLLPEAMERS